MHDKHPCPDIDAKLSLFIDFRWKSLKLIIVKTLIVFFEIVFEQKSILGIFSWNVSQSQ